MSTQPKHGFNRRQALQLIALSGGGLLVACSDMLHGGRPLSSSDFRNTEDEGNNTAFGDFIRVDTQGHVTVRVGASEIGQGVLTALAMVVAEELDADWERVKAEHSPVGAAWSNPLSGMQSTVGSTSVRGYFTDQRIAGAALRQLFAETAAARWQVPAHSLHTAHGEVIEPGSGRRIDYGELVNEAAQGTLNQNPELKSPDDFGLIGSNPPRLDGANKTDGSLVYGLDFSLPGMLTAVMARPPRFGGQALLYDESATLQVPGVVSVHRLPNGIAVVADSLWAAEQGRNALTVQWDPLSGGRTDSALQRQHYAALLELPGAPLRGLPLLQGSPGSRSLEADYHFPFQAHAAMEPLNVVVDYDGSRGHIWVGTQSPQTDQFHAAQVLGLSTDQVHIHRLAAGGGFGRRGNWLGDFVRQGCQLGRVLRQPVKLVWTREDDMRGGFYRPMCAARLRASFDPGGSVRSWMHRSVVQDLTIIDSFPAPSSAGSNPQNPSDLNETFAYAVDQVAMDIHLDVKADMPALWMRGVNKVTDAFAQEAFFDEVAQNMGRDPLELRRELLRDQPGLLSVLNRAAAEAGWDQPPPLPYSAPGRRAQGIAVFSHWDSFIAQVVDLSVTEDGLITLHRVISAVDCGLAVHPDLVRAQIESAVVYALTGVAFGEITLVDGEVQQSNFDDYPLLRLHQCPAMQTVILPSARHPGGVGELGMPCVGPALVNALLAAGRPPVRELPLVKGGYRLGERHPYAGAQA